MTKLYSFQWNEVAGIFFDTEGTTWWPLSWVVKTFSISGSSTSVLKKFTIAEHEKKRFQAFETSLVTFPKNSYFISKPGLERVLRASSSLKTQAFLVFLAHPEQNQTVLEVTTKSQFSLKKKVDRSSPVDQAVFLELIFDLLTFTKELTIALQIQESLSQDKREMGVRILKKLANLLESGKKKNRL